MNINFNVTEFKTNSIEIINAKTTNLDIYDKSFNLTEFKELFFNEYGTYCPNFKSINSNALYFKYHKLNSKEFNLLNQVIESYETDLNICKEDWEPKKKLCLMKLLLSYDKITKDITNSSCFFSYKELFTILEYEYSENSKTEFILKIPFMITSSNMEINNIIYNFNFKLVVNAGDF